MTLTLIPIRIRSAALILVLALVSFSAHAQATINPDHAAMKLQLEGVIDAYNAANIEAFASAYTEDAWVISMRRPIKASRDEIKTAFAPGMSKYLFKTELTVLDIEVHGDIAYMIGRSKLTGAPREGATVPPFVEERIYMAIFKREGPDWLIHRHMESTSPSSGPPIF